MQVSVEATTSLERRVTVTVPAEQIDSAVDKKVQETAKTIRLDGFRKGKVPAKVVKKRYGASIRQEVLGDVIQTSYFEALQEADINPAGMPEIVIGGQIIVFGLKIRVCKKVYQSFCLRLSTVEGHQLLQKAIGPSVFTVVVIFFSRFIL